VRVGRHTRCDARAGSNYNAGIDLPVLKLSRYQQTDRQEQPPRRISFWTALEGSR